MTDFVVGALGFKKSMYYEYNVNDNDKALSKIENYSKFLKQPLTLGMFVPCDEYGNLLEEKSIFNTTDEDYIFDSESFDKYKQAKERVLFDGFKEIEDRDKTYLHSDSFGSVFIDKKWAIRHCLVEDLIGIELTKSAI
jgi:hypothetical protein